MALFPLATFAGVLERAALLPSQEQDGATSVRPDILLIVGDDTPRVSTRTARKTLDGVPAVGRAKDVI